MFIACGADLSNIKYSSQFKTLTSAIDQTMFVGGMNTSVANWVYGTPHGPNLHPLEQGHQIIAEKINEHIGNLGRFS